jgi:hypothetical protein
MENISEFDNHLKHIDLRSGNHANYKIKNIIQKAYGTMERRLSQATLPPIS